MHKRGIALILLFVFISGTPLIFAEEHQARRKPCPGQRREDKANSADARVSEWTKELNLDAKQQAKVKEILSRSQDQTRAVLGEAKSKIKELKIKAHDEIKALLTEEQKQKFQKARQKHEGIHEIKE